MQGDPVMIHPTSKTLFTGAISAALAVALSACAPVSTRPDSNTSMQRPAAAPVDGSADWAWVVSGDNAVRPMQVFSLEGKTYLQMRTGQLIPAVVVDGQPVPFSIAAPYIVVQGEPQRIDLLARGSRAVLLHRGAVPAPPTIAPDRVQRIAVGGGDLPASPMQPENAPDPLRSVMRAPTVSVADVIKPAPVSVSRVWRIKPEQHLLSKALADWSQEAGVRLVWQSRVDVPITGSAEYREGSFLDAMGHALADASGDGYRFFYSMSGDKTITVVAVHAS
jgi:hypothetical protein